MAQDPLPVTVVPPAQPTDLEYALDALTAAGTLLAVFAAVLVAWWANRDRRREVQERRDAEEQLATDRKSDRQAKAIRVVSAWESHALDGYGRVSARVENWSEQTITSVELWLEPPLQYQHAPQGVDERLLGATAELFAGGSAEHAGQAYWVDQNPPTPPPCGVIFTDAWGDRWRRDFDSTLTLLVPRRVQTERQ